MRTRTAVWLGVITFVALLVWPELVLPAMGPVLGLVLAVWISRRAVSGRRWVR